MKISKEDKTTLEFLASLALQLTWSDQSVFTNLSYWIADLDDKTIISTLTPLFTAVSKATGDAKNLACTDFLSAVLTILNPALNPAWDYKSEINGMKSLSGVALSRAYLKLTFDYRNSTGQITQSSVDTIKADVTTAQKLTGDDLSKSGINIWCLLVSNANGSNLYKPTTIADLKAWNTEAKNQSGDDLDKTVENVQQKLGDLMTSIKSISDQSDATLPDQETLLYLAEVALQLNGSTSGTLTGIVDVIKGLSDQTLATKLSSLLNNISKTESDDSMLSCTDFLAGTLDAITSGIDPKWKYATQIADLTHYVGDDLQIAYVTLAFDFRKATGKIDSSSVGSIQKAIVALPQYEKDTLIQPIIAIWHLLISDPKAYKLYPQDTINQIHGWSDLAQKETGDDLKRTQAQVKSTLGVVMHPSSRPSVPSSPDTDRMEMLAAAALQLTASGSGTLSQLKVYIQKLSDKTLVTTLSSLVDKITAPTPEGTTQASFDSNMKPCANFLSGILDGVKPDIEWDYKTAITTLNTKSDPDLSLAYINLAFDFRNATGQIDSSNVDGLKRALKELKLLKGSDFPIAIINIWYKLLSDPKALNLYSAATLADVKSLCAIAKGETSSVLELTIAKMYDKLGNDIGPDLSTSTT